MTIFSFRGRASGRVWAAFVLALYLTVQLLASSTALHKLIHSDADSASHHCAITLFTRGQMNSAESLAPLAAFVAALFFLLPPLRSAVSSSFDYRFCASRAPPRR